MSPEVLSGIIIMAGYVALTSSTAALLLWGQRRFFLRPDEPQSFAIPGVSAVFVGLLYFWLVIVGSV